MYIQVHYRMVKYSMIFRIILHLEHIPMQKDIALLLNQIILMQKDIKHL